MEENNLCKSVRSVGEKYLHDICGDESPTDSTDEHGFLFEYGYFFGSLSI